MFIRFACLRAFLPPCSASKRRPPLPLPFAPLYMHTRAIPHIRKGGQGIKSASVGGVSPPRSILIHAIGKITFIQARGGWDGAKRPLKIFGKTLDIGSNWVYTGGRKRRKGWLRGSEVVTAQCPFFICRGKHTTSLKTVGVAEPKCVKSARATEACHPVELFREQDSGHQINLHKRIRCLWLEASDRQIVGNTQGQRCGC